MTVQLRFDEKTGELGVRKSQEPKFEVGDEVLLNKEYRIFEGVFAVDGIGEDIVSKNVSYSCHRINKEGHTIWFSSGDVAIEKA